MTTKTYTKPPKWERPLLAHEIAALCKPCRHCGFEFKKTHIDEHEEECEYNPENRACPTCDIGKQAFRTGFCNRVKKYYNRCYAPCDEWVAI
jgi:rubredoxin